MPNRYSQRLKRERLRDQTLPGWRQGASLMPGDQAVTDYELGYAAGGALKNVLIVARREERCSQSGVLLQVSPALKNNLPGEWFDAEWFAPAPLPREEP